MRRLSASLTKRCADLAAGMDWRPPTQVWKRKIHPPISAVGRAEQREERLVLIDWQQLTIAHCPALWGKVETHNSDLTEEGFGHMFDSLKSGFENYCHWLTRLSGRWAAGRDRSSSVWKSMNSVLLVGCYCFVNVAKFRMRGELTLNGLTVC
jgi:hypothetical protein